MESNSQVLSRRLRLITYLYPGIPIQYFEVLKNYLEEKLNRCVYLIVESRWSGPPAHHHTNPFSLDDADIGFVCSTAFRHVTSLSGINVEILGVAPVYSCNNPNGEENPVYFTDVIVNKENCEKFQTFEDLRGTRWSYNDKVSLSGYISIERELAKNGDDLSFFGSVTQSAGHLKSMQMILDKTIDCAGIDSNTLAIEMKRNPGLRERFHIVASLGPFPIYLTVVNSRLPEELKQSIAKHLLNMHNEPAWQGRLAEYLVAKFVPVTKETYKDQRDI